MAESDWPAAFSALQPFLGWALATEAERTHKRQTSEMADIQAFYVAMLSHLEDVLVYLNKFPLERMPPHAQQLMDMTLSLAEIAPAVELFGQPREDDTFDPFRFVPQHH